MRLRTTLLSLLVAAPVLANGPQRPTLAPIPLADVAEQCTSIGKQANVASVQLALSARVSLANCLADTRLVTLKLLDCEESVLAVEEATRPSFEILDGVIAAADDVTKIVAEHAKAELYAQMTLRMRQTLPAAGTSASELALHNVRKDLLEGMLARWKEAAFASYERILLAAKARPALEKNPVVATAVRTAKDRLRLHVAAATPAPTAASTSPAQRDGAKTDTGEALR